jgi:hypothetical protein
VLLRRSPTVAVTTLEMHVAGPLYPVVEILPDAPACGGDEPRHSTSIWDGESIARTLKPRTYGSSALMSDPRCAVEILGRAEICGWMLTDTRVTV